MGVLNFAHASFYMVGAYMGFAVSQIVGFWAALLLVPLLVGLLGALFEKYSLRKVHKYGHVPELMVTFGLSYIILELVQLIWGRIAVEFRPPELLQGSAFTLLSQPDGSLGFAWGRAALEQCQPLGPAICSLFPATRAFIMGVALLMLVSLWLLITRTRVGLVIQAALKHPEMVEALGHNVPRVFMLVFGAGTGLAGLAGVMGGSTFVTEPAMALTLGAIVFVVVVVGGLGSLGGALVAALLVGALQTWPLGWDVSLADGLRALGWPLGPETPGWPLWRLTLAQAAPMLPYALLVAVLVWRPQGLAGRDGA